MILFATLVVALLAGAEACPPSFTFINGHCFSFQSQVVLPWAEAQEFCGNMSTTLAVVRSPTTLRGIYEYIMTYGLDGSYWLDASDIMYEGDWVWSDDSRVERGTPFWAIRHGLFGWSHEPNGGKEENCLALDESRLYYFNDVSCEALHHPLCQGS
ncbi:C-type lectin BML-2-like [Panulirus ornatus]|uniref:C-type lectin BML-2-like n=1 Tax=Panulirus ornatus TaxID=150431 RepID=UPI003A8C68F2